MGVTDAKDGSADELVRWLERVALDRDEEAFANLFRHYYPRLYSFMQRAGIGAREAEELVQESMLKVWSNAAQYRAHLGPPNAWVYAVARNVRADGLRKRRVPVDLSTAQDYVGDSAAGTTDPSVDALIIIDKLQELAPEQTTVLKLTYLDGLTQTEISAQLNVPLGTVKSRVRLAVKNLRARLGLA